MPTPTCQHEACACAVEAGERFCSDSCRRTSDDPTASRGTPCPCGHVACSADAGERDAPSAPPPRAAGR